MAKALTMILLLVSGAAVTSAHPIIGKGGLHALQGLLESVLVESTDSTAAAANQEQQQQVASTNTQTNAAMNAQVNAQMDAQMNNTAWNSTESWNNTAWNATAWNATEGMNATAWNETMWNATANATGNATADMESRTTTTTTTTTTGSQTQTLSQFLTETIMGAHGGEQSYLDVKIPLPFHHKKHIAVQKEPEVDLSKCECKDDCKEDTRKKCKAIETPEEKCEEVPQEEDVEVCEFKCFKADNVIEVGGHHGHPLLGGRRLAAASTAGLPHALAKAALGALTHHGEGTVEKKVPQVVKQQEVCKEVCKSAKKPLPPKKVCKKVVNVEYVDCVVEIVSKRCVKHCKCGEKTVTVAVSPDFHAIHKALTHQG